MRGNEVLSCECCENVLMESQMTWDLGHTRPRKYLSRSNESEAARDISSTFPENDVETGNRVYPSFQLPNVERAIKSYDKFRSEQAILNGAKSRIVLGVS